MSKEDTRQLRKVVSRDYGEAVANSLEGQALIDMVGYCLKTPTVNAQQNGAPDMAEHLGHEDPPATNNQQSGVPDMAEHFGHKTE